MTRDTFCALLLRRASMIAMIDDAAMYAQFLWTLFKHIAEGSSPDGHGWRDDSQISFCGYLIGDSARVLSHFIPPPSMSPLQSPRSPGRSPELLRRPTPSWGASPKVSRGQPNPMQRPPSSARDTAAILLPRPPPSASTDTAPAFTGLRRPASASGGSPPSMQKRPPSTSFDPLNSPEMLRHAVAQGLTCAAGDSPKLLRPPSSSSKAPSPVWQPLVGDRAADHGSPISPSEDPRFRSFARRVGARGMGGMVNVPGYVGFDSPISGQPGLHPR